MLYPKHRNQVSGGHRERVTPVPIPNTAVKPLIADDTARATVWESRTSPDKFFLKSPRDPSRAFRFCGALLSEPPQPGIRPVRHIRAQRALVERPLRLLER